MADKKQSIESEHLSSLLSLRGKGIILLAAMRFTLLLL